MKKLFFIILLLGGFCFLGVPGSWSFNLNDFVKDLDKATKPPQKNEPVKEEPPPAPSDKKSQPAEQPPAEQQGGGGLIGLGESLGVFDKKTSNILKQGVGTVQAFQPIGYEEERAIGGSLALEVFNRFGGPYPNDHLKHYVNLVGQSVAELSDRPDIPYHFAVLNSPDPNAFATPGGYVFVSIGLVNLLENEAQLAGVLGHEIAHVTQKHALKTLQRSKMLKGMSGLSLSIMDKDPGLYDKLINEVSDLLFTRGLDQDLEFEADVFGTEFAYRVGYYPGGLRNFIKTLAKTRKAGSSIFFSTHPNPRDRYRRLTQVMGRYKEGILNPVLAQRYAKNARGQK